MRAIRIMIAEDDPGCADLLVDCLMEAMSGNHVEVVADGDQVMDYLRNRGCFAGRPRPDLLLLDLNMPRKNGHETLEEMKADESLRSIPVIILSSSDDEGDVARSYRLQAAAHVCKPHDLASLDRIVGAIDSFWLSQVLYPPGRR